MYQSFQLFSSFIPSNKTCQTHWLFNPLTITICPDLFAHNSPAGSAKELFKPSKDVASLVVSIKK